MSLPRYLPHYTVADYQQWDGDWELWHGVAVAMTPSPFGIHQWLSGQFAHQVIQQLNDQRCVDCHILQEVDWIIEEDTVVRPDLSLVCGPLPARFIEQVPILIIEILSESTQDKDTRAKWSLYVAQGVKYYVIVNPWSWSCEGFVAKRRKYSSLKAGAPLSIHAGCQLQLAMPPHPVPKIPKAKPTSSRSVKKKA
jgi:Uma2 family endonuclease